MITVIRMIKIQLTLDSTDPHSTDFRFNRLFLQPDKVLGLDKMFVSCKEIPVGVVAGDRTASTLG